MIGESSDRRCRLVGAGVVAHEKLEARIRLLQDAPDGMRQDLCSVVRGHHDAHQRESAVVLQPAVVVGEAPLAFDPGRKKACWEVLVEQPFENPAKL